MLHSQWASHKHQPSYWRSRHTIYEISRLWSTKSLDGLIHCCSQSRGQADLLQRDASGMGLDTVGLNGSLPTQDIIWFYYGLIFCMVLCGDKLDSIILMGPFHLGIFYDYEQLKDAREKYVRVCICSLRKYLFLAQPNLPLWSPNHLHSAP